MGNIALVSYKIVSYKIVSYKIVSYKILSFEQKVINNSGAIVLRGRCQNRNMIYYV